MVLLIALESNDAPTLGDKEARYFDNCETAIFLVTPRESDGTISGSVIHEMGQAKQKFKSSPEKVIFLADTSCKFPSIEQRPRNTFIPGDLNSIFRVFQVFIADLKKAGLIGLNRGSETYTAVQPRSILQEVIADAPLADTLVFLSGQDDGVAFESELRPTWFETHKLNQRQVNYLKRALIQKRLAKRDQTLVGSYEWRLEDRGWDLAKEISAHRAEAIKVFVGRLTGKT